MFSGVFSPLLSLSLSLSLFSTFVVLVLFSCFSVVVFCFCFLFLFYCSPVSLGVGLLCTSIDPCVVPDCFVDSVVRLSLPPPSPPTHRSHPIYLHQPNPPSTFDRRPLYSERCVTFSIPSTPPPDLPTIPCPCDTSSVTEAPSGGLAGATTLSGWSNLPTMPLCRSFTSAQHEGDNQSLARRQCEQRPKSLRWL